jgi:hypothetical protein
VSGASEKRREMPQMEKNLLQRLMRIREGSGIKRGCGCGTMRRGHRVRLGREMDKVGVLGRRWAGLLPLGPFYLSRPTFLSI